ncbi:MAG: Xaa-Pro aminopeptidase [Kofleriaceae bacterium]|nr:Xaa-Pro aminopeptidase [Kofleriaceae bacterium]MCB9574371.1 Xaa-Pro aminopeptidase [Kofleriaceae bacterium]
MLDPSVFAARREAYLRALGPGGVAVVASLPERVRNGDSHYRFRQHSDLHYLTGFTEPEAVLVLRGNADAERVVMFVRPRDPEMEVWDGRRAGIEGARDRYGADAAYPIAELSTRLWDLIANHEELHYSLGLDDAMDKVITAALARLRRTEKRGRRPPRAVVDPRVALHEQRLIKSPEELAVLRKAAAITVDAHLAAMAAGRPGTFEYELEAVIDYTFRHRGGAGPGYGTIVGAGENATVLHYVDNACAIAEGDLVLVDAGCEYGHYTADVTRTFPASGRFTGPQRAIYEAVLDAQRGAIELAAPGATLDRLHEHCIRRLTQAMVDLGLLAGSVDDRIADASYKRFYMHGTSHWLGMDVHDVGAYTRSGAARPLEAGMVITIEPGLYVAVDAADVPAEYRGIGVRIEDDVVITADGHEVLTARAPTSIDDVEAACG